MANHKSSAAQAIKDMLEMDVDVTIFTGNIKKLHVMNAEIGIITKEKVVKRVIKTEVKVSVNINYMVPEATKPLPRRTIIINPDGTVALGTDWDRD